MKATLVTLAALFGYGINAGETITFHDDFNTFNTSRWFHEQTMSGGGNWEFEWYVNNRTNSFVRDGVLYPPWERATWSSSALDMTGKPSDSGSMVFISVISGMVDS